MTETTPEQPIEPTLDDVETNDDDQVEEVEEVEQLDPERDADDVAEDRLTGVAVYDNLERHYVGGKHANKTEARRDAIAGRLLKDHPERYSLRRV